MIKIPAESIDGKINSLNLDEYEQKPILAQCDGVHWNLYFEGDELPEEIESVPEPGWEGLYDDLDDSALLSRIVENSIEFPQVGTPLALLIALITTTKKLSNLQDRLNLVATVLSVVGKPLTPMESQWLNARLQARGFTQSL